jgi:hypothetical protein
MRQQRPIRQRQLFEQTPAAPAVQVSKEVQEQIKQILVQWLQALARAIDEEHGDEQDYS